MRIIAYKSLVRFIESLRGNSDQSALAGALLAWHEEARNAIWRSPADVKTAYRNASIVGHDRVVFNIKGNDYRLVVSIDYARQVVFVKWVGSHAAYDRIDVRTVDYGD
jgi:mRNA interferase HigB